MFASSGRARMAYESTGVEGGVDVLLIHAGVNDRRSWWHVTERLSPRHRCVAFDMRGFGETVHEREDGTAPTLVMLGRLDAEEIQVIDEQVVTLIPGARLRLLDGVAHVPHLEGDPATLDEIAAFVDATRGKIA